jgi:low affinity Fe/Cu permease
MELCIRSSGVVCFSTSRVFSLSTERQFVVSTIVICLVLSVYFLRNMDRRSGEEKVLKCEYKSCRNHGLWGN